MFVCVCVCACVCACVCVRVCVCVMTMCSEKYFVVVVLVVVGGVFCNYCSNVDNLLKKCHTSGSGSSSQPWGERLCLGRTVITDVPTESFTSETYFSGKSTYTH